MERVTEISNEAIENMNMELAVSILLHCRCPEGSCSECLRDCSKHRDFTCDVTLEKALKYVESHIGELCVTSPIASPKEEIPEPAPVDTLPYEGIRSFMKDRGYTRCYMCGASLKEGGKE